MKFGVFRLRLHLFSGLAFLKRRCYNDVDKAKVRAGE
jgi:hypothetical protein